MKPRALISVYDKDGITALAAFLAESGWEILSTGGTARYLRDAGIPVIDVSAVTGFPECLDGRVKTLHPAIHAGILARRSESAHRETLNKLSLAPINLVCVNLYPFFEKVRKGLSPAETIEFIDIGGPALLRSAAKNFADVIALTESEDYPAAIEEIKSGSKNIPLRRHLAAKVFNLTAAYDAAVGRYLSDVGGAAPGPFAVFPRYWQVPFEKSAELRYGENSHQRAALYRFADAGGFVRDMERLNGKELSFNNIRDLDLAWKAASSFGYASEPPGGTVFTPALGSAELRSLSIDCPPPAACCVAVKHNTPCGIGQADAGGRAAYEAFVKAKACDPVSIFGGITAFNCAVDAKTAAALNELFLEIVAAPAFTDDALDLLRQKKNLRVIRIPYPPRDVFESVSVDGGILVQDAGDRLFQKWEVVTREAPPPELLPSLIFGMRSVCWSKSNAIAVVKEGALLGAGSGETNRISAAKLALRRAADRARALGADIGADTGLSGGELAALPAALRDGAPPAVLASDAFFPFADIVECAARYGIKAIIQCGGSTNDDLSIEACDRYGIAMIFTGIRCFKH